MTVHWEEVLRANGLRVTPQRQLVFEAVDQLRHATPEQILAQVQQTASGINLSTVYRTLEVLEGVGLVTHAHIGHGAPTYHAIDEDTHIHVVCDSCRAVLSVPAPIAEPFVQALRDDYGFESDITHMSIQGQCRKCADAGR
jgi:Fur family ferric uptake transcriptional regulator